MAEETTIPKSRPKKKKIVSKRLSIPKPKKSASSRSHDRWYKKLFSDPMVVEDLLRSFVKEDFVKKLNFNSIQKVNTEFVSPSGDVRRRRTFAITHSLARLYVCAATKYAQRL